MAATNDSQTPRRMGESLLAAFRQFVKFPPPFTGFLYVRARFD
jgi:hypothetical protein